MLPARVPNLLINGTSGIAVGIATKIPPHNMREVVEGLKALIHNPDITVRQLMRHIPAPDFPTGALAASAEGTFLGAAEMPQQTETSLPPTATGGEIILTDAVRQAYEEGKGGILMRAKIHIEDGSGSTTAAGGAKRKPKRSGSSGSGKPLVVITELPYQTNKVRGWLAEHFRSCLASFPRSLISHLNSLYLSLCIGLQSALVEQIARLVDAGTLTGVSDIRDESDRDGVRVVVEVKRGELAGCLEVEGLQCAAHTTNRMPWYSEQTSWCPPARLAGPGSF